MAYSSLAAIALGLALQAEPTTVATVPAPSEPAVRLEDIEITGRRLNDVISQFVQEVAAPNRGRGLARWKDTVCVGVVQFEREAGEYLADRISTVASDLGLRVGKDGCRPNILLIGTRHPDVIATRLIDRKRRYLRPGGSGMDQGRAALEAFRTSDKPVRWWQVAYPVDSHSGNLASRIPGQCASPCESIFDYAPTTNIFAASRVSTQIVDDLQTALVIIDADKLDGININQLADYVAMVSLAQIDPKADTSGYVSILNLFDNPAATPMLTDWDTAYLNGMYAAQRIRLNRIAAAQEIVASIHRAHQQLAADAPDEQ